LFIKTGGHISYVITAGIGTENGFRQAETVVFVDQQKQGLRLSIHAK
jgi:hypothetical protein